MENQEDFVLFANEEEVDQLLVPSPTPLEKQKEEQKEEGELEEGEMTPRKEEMSARRNKKSGKSRSYRPAIIVEFEITREGAKLPSKETAGSNGRDLSSTDRKKIHPGQTAKISVGFKMRCPPGVIPVISSRSGLAVKHGLCVKGGLTIIDSDFPGTISVPLKNESNVPFTVTKGMRVAQMLFLKDAGNEIVFQETVIHPTPGGRSEEGYGSTGLY